MHHYNGISVLSAKQREFTTIGCIADREASPSIGTVDADFRMRDALYMACLNALELRQSTQSCKLKSYAALGHVYDCYKKKGQVQHRLPFKPPLFPPKAPPFQTAIPQIHPRLMLA